MYSPANNCSVGNEIILLGFVGVTWVGESCNKNLSMLVIAEKMKICCYPQIGKNPYLHFVS
jgi:hypothetical protein